MLQYRETLPSNPLRDYLECYWTLQADFPLVDELCLPDGSVSLVFNFGEPYFRAAAKTPAVRAEIKNCCLAFQGKESFLISQKHPIRILGVRFKPYGMSAMFSVSMTDFPVPLLLQGEAVKGFIGNFDDTALRNTDSFYERIAILESFLSDKLTSAAKPDELVVEAVTIMMRNEGNLKISELLDQLCVSKSTLEKKFQDAVGLSPKILCNILRFNSIVYNHKRTGAPSLTELTYNQGFFDQAHLVHNFKSFTGQPPGRFFRQDNRLLEMLRQSFEARVSEIY
jgi:AraC-like DNA-binding protein